ncbi:hypothetical protein PBCV1_a344R [Paramecium bursaria Chlorella virus 1]|uniref:Uncharacterized protein n=1 Tax=Paramecium bursaria Chlorella virus 1 TaxID=10506 RepID=Q84658_PBCV1|nr:hypothetical protein PBCV1_a344R [Paramecium bursaria Chlorella virus 1]AAC96712.1 hypothetical protein [Paramecium bursaria Chlorella virus 1]
MSAFWLKFHDVHWFSGSHRRTRGTCVVNVFVLFADGRFRYEFRAHFSTLLNNACYSRGSDVSVNETSLRFESHATHIFGDITSSSIAFTIRVNDRFRVTVSSARAAASLIKISCL